MARSQGLGAVWAAAGAVALGMLAPACQSQEFEPIDIRAVKVGTRVVEVEAKQLPPNIMLVVDRSGSMMQSVTGTGQACSVDGTNNSAYDPRSPNPCKWNDLKSVLADPANGILVRNEGLARFGLLAYPGDEAATSSGTCAPGRIEVPIGDSAVPIRDQILNNIFPAGGTPTAAALLDAAKDPALAVADTNRQRFVMLLTDGLPNCNEANRGRCAACRSNASTCGAADGCRPTDGPADYCDTRPFDGAACLDDNGLIGAVQQLRNVGIGTFVIGFGRATAGSAAAEVLNRAAEEGGHARTDAAEKYYQANSAAELRAFLDEILQPFPCTFTFDMPPRDGNLVSVEIIDRAAGGRARVLAPGTDWTFTSPALEGVKIIGQACTTIQNALQGGQYTLRISYATGL